MPAEPLTAGSGDVPERRVLTPLTAFTEMAVLEREGRAGWHVVDYGTLFHVVEASDVPWEHRRVPWSPTAARRMAADGWTLVRGATLPVGLLQATRPLTRLDNRHQVLTDVRRGPVRRAGRPRTSPAAARAATRPGPGVDLAAAHPISRPAISRHLRLLTEAGLASVEDRGRERHYALDSAGLAQHDRRTLRRGHVGGVGMDVYEDESAYFFQDWSSKSITDNKLVALLGNFHNVVLTAHQAFFTREAINEIVATTLQNARDYFVNDLTGALHPNNCIDYGSTK